MKFLKHFFFSCASEELFIWINTLSLEYLPNEIKLSVNYFKLLRQALSKTVLLQMGLVQSIDRNWNGSMHSCLVHSLTIMQIHWATLDRDQFSGMKNVISHNVNPNAMSSSGLVVQKGCEETGEVQQMAVKVACAQSTSDEKRVQDLCPFTVVKRRLESNLISVYHYWKCSYKDDR